MQEKKSKIIHLAIALNNLHHRISILVKINTVILHMFLLQWLKNSAFPRNTNAVENVHCSCFFSFLSIVCVCVCVYVCVCVCVCVCVGSCGKWHLSFSTRD